LSSPEKNVTAVRTLGRVSVLIACTILGTWLNSHINITTSPSLKERVYWIDNSAQPESLRDGDAVLFYHADKSTGFKEKLITKRIACNESEEFKSDSNGDYYCNGRFLVRAKVRFLNGSTAERFNYKGNVPAGSMFVVGDHKDSYDSRYYGFIEKGRVVAKAYPLF
jgi:conjugal transfer pilin signal peptidase TrbI